MKNATYYNDFIKLTPTKQLFWNNEMSVRELIQNNIEVIIHNGKITHIHPIW